MDTFEYLLYETAHRSEKTIPTIAGELGISSSYLYRACLPEGPSKAKLPSALLLPLMKITSNFSIAKFMALQGNIGTYDLPQMPAHTKEKSAFIFEFQLAFIDVQKLLMEYFNAPTDDKIPSIQQAIDKILGFTLAAKHIIEKENLGQMEMHL